MTSDQPESPPPPNVAALVDAIDARSRQAGADGATEVMARMLGSINEALAGIQDRLDQVEDAMTTGAGGAGAAGAAALAEAVQSGLATFNARLGRLEEAFVQAVDESGSGTQAVVDEVRTVVTRVLEESSPAEGATLDPAARDALARVEAAVSVLVSGRDERPAHEVVELALAALGDRLDGLERRLVEAVRERPAASAPAPTPVEVDLSPLVDRLGAVERRLQDAPRDVSASVEATFELLQGRLAGLEQVLRARSKERVDPTAAVRAAMAPVLERMDELDASSRSTAARSGEGVGRVETALAALPGRLTSLEERVGAVVSSLTEAAASSPVDASVLARLEASVDRLDRDEASARLVKLVEERMSVGLRAVTERTDEVRRAVEQLATVSSSASSDDGVLDDLVASVRALQSATRQVPDEVASTIASRLVPLSDRLAGLDVRLDALASASEATPDPTEALARLASQLDTLTAAVTDTRAPLEAVTSKVDTLAGQIEALGDRPATSEAPGTGIEQIVEQINGALRREAELLTQRVAALAVGVEAARVLLEQHVQETENSIGRKAGEVTRRLAADFGMKSKRTGPGGRRDPRELGSG